MVNGRVYKLICSFFIHNGNLQEMFIMLLYEILEFYKIRNIIIPTESILYKKIINYNSNNQIINYIIKLIVY